MNTTYSLKTLSSAANGLLAMTALFALASPASLRAAETPGYWHETTTVLYQTDWMRNLPDSLKLSQMSIPGTHDTMSHDWGDASITQTMDLENQLASGIRSIDIRLADVSDHFQVTHSKGIQLGLDFDTVMSITSNFLYQHPGETIVMRIKDDNDDFNFTNSHTFEQDFLPYLQKYRQQFWAWDKNNQNPTLGQLRGKIFIIQDFTSTNTYGLDWSTYQHSSTVQDQYNLNSNWDLYNKWTAVENNLGEANFVFKVCVNVAGREVCTNPPASNQNLLYVNYLSGSGGSLPYFVASGKSDPATGAPQLLTGLTTPAFKSWYPDFPRVGCFLGMCSIAFEGTNDLTYHWIAEAQRERVGILMIDFPSPTLIAEIIAVNQKAVQGFPAVYF